MIQKNKGITLIALIITIIVLLILAVVSIKFVTNNGILGEAESATNNYKIAQIKERVVLAVNAAKLDRQGILEKTAIEEELTNEFGENNYEVTVVGKGYLIIVENVQYLVNEDGTVEDGADIEKTEMENAGDLSKGGQYDGTTKETAYRITCIEDLVEWTNNYSKYSSKYIVLENTIDFENISDYNNYKAKTKDINGNGEIEPLITELTTGTGFKPIASFAGTFDGQGNEIRNIYENTTGNAGLFAMVKSSTIKNLGVTGEISTTGSSAGGIIGIAPPNASNRIYNCYNLGNIEATSSAGGIMGGTYGMQTFLRYYNCYNGGKIKALNAGGIVSDIAGDCKIINCYNIGDIEASNYMGGIIANTVYTAIPYISNCFNIGNIKNLNGGKTAGIIYDSWGYSNLNLETISYLDNADMLLVLLKRKPTTNLKAPSTKEYMQSQEFVDELNNYVDSYETDAGEEDVPLLRWKYNQGDYPTFEN